MLIFSRCLDKVLHDQIKYEYSMSHARRTIFTLLTLSDFLKLNFLEEMTLKKIKQGSFDESAFFSSAKSVADIGFITKMSYASSEFATMCKKDLYRQLWSDLYSQLGLSVSAFTEKQITFYEHENIDSFDLLRGTYFFYLSQQVKAALPNKLSYSELRFLKEAMRFNSVHAVQRYNIVLFDKVTHGQFEEDESAKELLMEAIKNAKSLLELYGSYAYMLLAEAYYQYAQWAQEHESITTYRRALQAAIASCDNATKYLDKSQYSIHNASFGQGLGFSNSFGLDSPAKAKEVLEEMLKQSLEKIATAKMS
ncbi:hypothetical protein CAB17_16680 [Legionella sainthelensi]|uniref:Uncharacterized protein n=2 Tax=Legionella sainthelensi TaxID=28087 RepID=A0A2H5FR24_9GAMM|nr:hypothetical protein CAB17_16680 [Legionella sainthelensi]